ncbi:c-type cytochrome [Variovorax terrae]|uniref:C-type cytochrome n=1 Tax=Variovorax terrae TaxID=2923278 RepID=A0A9X2AN37_9BURK|nr:c-type cytochrome [Variovorax terrae]MCJ0764388.1 c-type cytochrome [Variovorax terrae]
MGAGGWPARQALAAALLAACAAGAPAQSVERGRQLYETRCGACHSVDANRVGPMHQGVLGRRAGSVPGFDYSPALAHAGFRWDRARLLAWLTDPEALVPGQKMGYRLEQAQDREDVVAYLATLK